MRALQPSGYEGACMPPVPKFHVANLLLMSLPEEATRSQSPRRRGRPKIETPNPVDVRVGARLRLRRKMLGLSQEKLGETIGVTFQQMQKYERGATRVGAGRLHE